MSRYLLILFTVLSPFCSFGQSADSVYTQVDRMPELISVPEFLTANIRYPDKAKDENIEGRVTIKFIIDEEGEITNAQVVRGIGGGCDEEALRVVRSLPRAKPGILNGKPVKVYFTLPIVFKLEGPEEEEIEISPVAFHSKNEIVLYKDAVKFARAGKYEQAIRMYVRASANGKDNPVIYYDWALALRDLHMTNEAVTIATKAYDAAVKSDTLYKLFGYGAVDGLMKAYVFNGNYDKAITFGKGILKSVGDTAYFARTIREVEVLRDTRLKSDEELKSMLKNLRQWSRNLPAMLELGMRYDARGFKTEAFLLYAICAMTNPRGESSYLGMLLNRYQFRPLLSGEGVFHARKGALASLDKKVYGIFAGNAKNEVLIGRITAFVDEFNKIAELKKDDFIVNLYSRLLKEIADKKLYADYYYGIIDGFWDEDKKVMTTKMTAALIYWADL